MKMTGFLYCTITLLVLCQVVFCLDIYVNKKSGIDNSTCWQGGLAQPCVSLSLALEGLQQFNKTTVWISNGTYALGSSITVNSYFMTGYYQYIWMRDIAITAHSGINQSVLNPDVLPVRVECSIEAGLTFIHTTNITIRGIQFVGCGIYQNTTSRISTSLPFEGIYITLYFLFASDVTLEYVTVTETPGTGVVMYATVGKNRISNSNFSFNAPESNYSGGGGLYIEFPYCVPYALDDCSIKTNVPPMYLENSVYTIDHCTFQNNGASIQNESDSTFILPNLGTHLALGRGGGLSIFFKGDSMNNTIQVQNSIFLNNAALWGAGVFVEHQDNSTKNNFSMESTLIEGNTCFHSSSKKDGTGGGGARIGHIFFDSSHASHNNMSFRNVTFTKNQAYYGGGLSLYTAKEPTESEATNIVEFHDCNWTSNIARVGSGVDLSMWHPIPYGAITKPNFINCTFRGNTAHYTSVLGSFEGIGAFYSDFVPVDFIGSVRFESNHETALASIGARIRFLPGCVAYFFNNSGRNGGAVALMGYSFLEVSNDTVLNFVENKAKIKGGAIFGQSSGERDLISSRNCFIRYTDIKVGPYDWEVTFNFQNNTANSLVNSIYVTSLLTCLWGAPYGSTQQGARDVFCWNKNNTNAHWTYSSDCLHEISTAPAQFVPRKNSSENCVNDTYCYFSMSVIPGFSSILPFSTQDDRGHNVTNATVLIAKLMDKSDVVVIDNSSLYISDNSIKIHGMPNDSVYIQLETIDPRVISAQIEINFSLCPPGMTISKADTELQCICSGNYGGFIQCHPSLFYSELVRGAWIGKQENSSLYIVGECPYCSLFTNNSTLVLSQDNMDLADKQCHSINRTGILCGKCLPDYGPVVNGHQFQCHYCPPSKAKYNWIFYLMTEFLPITVFFFIVVFFNISATSGPANAFVFFAQVITTVFNVDGDGAIQLNTITNEWESLQAVYLIPYDIWNQNFFHPFLPKFCLSSQISTLQLISTGYITALYPLLLVVIFSLLVWAYGRGFMPIVRLCRPVHKCFIRFHGLLNLQRSIVHALATFLLLSYTKFTLVSFILLTSTPLFNDTGKVVSKVLYYDGSIKYMGRHHIPYMILSVVVLATFVALPPVLLLAPSLILLTKKLCGKLFHKDLDFPSWFNPGPRLNQFLNAFHGCYKDGTGGDDGNIDYRWFAGLYFIFRLILFLIYAFTPNWFLQYVMHQLVCIVAVLAFIIFRPYKNHLFNVIDSCIFATLVAISTLSMYNYYLTAVGTGLSTWGFAVQYILIFLPLVYMVAYVMFMLKRKYCKRRNLLNEGDSFLNFTDEAVQYRNFDGSYQRRMAVQVGTHSVLPEEEETSSQDSTYTRTTKSSRYGAIGDINSSNTEPAKNVQTSMKNGESDDILLDAVATG